MVRKTLFILFLTVSVMFSGCTKKAEENKDVNSGTLLSDAQKESQENKAVKAEEQKEDKKQDTSEQKLKEDNQQAKEEQKTKEQPKEANNKDTKAVKESTTTQTQKAKNKVIVLDAGHANRSNLEKEKNSPDSNEMKIKDGGGAQGISSKTPEHVITLSIANRLKALLEKEGYTVIMTRTSPSQSLGNIERAEIGNNAKADLVLRIHADSSESSSVKGASMLVPAKRGYAKDIADTSKKYGQTILNSLVNTAKMNNRGISERNDLTGFNWSKVPVVLVEMGFLSNQQEDKSLNDDGYQNKLAEGLNKGIQEVLK